MQQEAAVCRYLDGMTSERVDAAGVANIAEAVKAAFPSQVLHKHC